ncbi:MAG: ORF6N domain-containing protein [Candidatus Omnitrophica bacterium]|nr:ORF6N domain-containing protein [Candidatus Omnitrophota bacterium]
MKPAHLISTGYHREDHSLRANLLQNKSIIETSFITQEAIVRKIYLLRGEKVMLDRDLAELYQVETRALNQAVRRNIDRFPSDFMFILFKEEVRRISQFVISLKFSKSVTAFTEQGVAMLSSVLNSKKVVYVNIEIIRTFTKLRKYLLSHRDLQKKIAEIEQRYDGRFRNVFEAIKELEGPIKAKRNRQIGFHAKY